MSHTPGPWHWVNPDTDEPWNGESATASLRTVRIYQDPDGGFPGHPHIFDLPRFILEYCEMGRNAKEDARLIAAAPALLAALRGLVTLCQEDETYHDPEHEPDSYAALKQAEAAIALAERGQAEAQP